MTVCVKGGTFFSHAGSKTFLQSAISTLVSLVLIDCTVSLEPARVYVVFADTPPEETLTAVARRRAIVFPSRPVQAYRAEWTDAKWWRHRRISQWTNQRRRSARTDRWRHRWGRSHEIGRIDVMVMRRRSYVDSVMNGSSGGKTQIRCLCRNIKQTNRQRGTRSQIGSNCRFSVRRKSVLSFERYISSGSGIVLALSS